MALAPRSSLGPYEIRGMLGAGGMGTVYRAHDPRLARDIALKILPEELCCDAESLARFTREARAVAALNHPHIVTIHSTEGVDGLQFITMELIEGRTLDQLITRTGVSPAQFFTVSIAIAEALAAAAAEAFERSIALDPTNAPSHAWFGWVTWNGREATAIAAARRVQELDPLNPYIHTLTGMVLDSYGRSEEGLREFDKAFEIRRRRLFPASSHAHVRELPPRSPLRRAPPPYRIGHPDAEWAAVTH